MVNKIPEYISKILSNSIRKYFRKVFTKLSDKMETRHPIEVTHVVI